MDNFYDEFLRNGGLRGHLGHPADFDRTELRPVDFNLLCIKSMEHSIERMEVKA